MPAVKQNLPGTKKGFQKSCGTILGIGTPKAPRVFELVRVAVYCDGLGTPECLVFSVSVPLIISTVYVGVRSWNGILYWEMITLVQVCVGKHRDACVFMCQYAASESLECVR
jgi:hypothetical protein